MNDLNVGVIGSGGRGRDALLAMIHWLTGTYSTRVGAYGAPSVCDKLPRRAPDRHVSFPS